MPPSYHLPSPDLSSSVNEIAPTYGLSPTYGGDMTYGVYQNQSVPFSSGTNLSTSVDFFNASDVGEVMNVLRIAATAAGGDTG